MGIHPLAGQPAPASILVDVSKLIAAYLSDKPDTAVREQRVAFGTSGHRGSSFKRSFNEWHILAITQAICEYRASQGTDGPLYLGRDTRTLGTSFVSAIEVLAANGIEVMIDPDGGYTPLRSSLTRYSPIIEENIRSCRRHCHHSLPQSAGGWRHQVQPTAWRAGRYPGDKMD